VQPFGHSYQRKRWKILGAWYTNNAAPDRLMNASLQAIKQARDQTIHQDVLVTTASWNPVPNNPFACTVGKPDAPAGHASIIASIRRCIRQADEAGYAWEALCFLEHDVLYPADYFERMGRALAEGSDIVVNLDYEGLNGSGWLRTVNRHEPMHQMCMTRETALANLERAEDECRRNGGCLLEPDSLLPCNAETYTGLLGIDFDGTITSGIVPYWREFAVITGRGTGEMSEIVKIVGSRPVYCRPASFPATNEGVAAHKARTIKLLEVVEFWEENAEQAEIIRRECPEVKVHHVGAQALPNRDKWYRIKVSVSKDRPFGLMPSIHVNW
jgi:hypothetical protein